MRLRERSSEAMPKGLYPSYGRIRVSRVLSVNQVRETLHRWQEWGLGGLWDAPKPGGIRRWQESDMRYLEDCLRNDPRHYNAKQLAQKLEQDRQIQLSPAQIRQILRQRG